MKILCGLVALYFTAAWHDVLRTTLAIDGVGPEPLAILALIWAFTQRGRTAIVGAALTGGIADLSGAGRLGPSVLTLGLAALAIDRCRPLGIFRHRISQGLLLGMFVGVLDLSQSLPATLDVKAAVPWEGLVRWSIGKGLYAAAIGWPLLAAIAAGRRLLGLGPSRLSRGYLDLARR